MMNMKDDEENGKYIGMMNGRAHKVRRLSRNNVLKNIGLVLSRDIHFDLILWYVAKIIPTL